MCDLFALSERANAPLWGDPASTRCTVASCCNASSAALRYLPTSSMRKWTFLSKLGDLSVS